MCVLNDIQLIAWAASGGLTPYAAECVNPASVDLRWSGAFKISTFAGWSETIQADELWMRQGDFYLLDTVEYVVMPEMCAGELFLKSSLGRQGLEHLHAGWFDPGFHGTATLEMENRSPRPLRLTRGQRLVQLVLHKMDAAPDKSYLSTGHYNGQRGPTEAR
jgi:dCTP deaminase